MKDPKAGKTFSHYETKASATIENPAATMLWDFTEPWELVPGEWVFEVSRGKKDFAEDVQGGSAALKLEFVYLKV